MKLLFVFSAVYFSYMLGCVANPVNTMRNLLSYSGWRVLADHTEGLIIIERQEGTGLPDRRLNWDFFTATQVTMENVAEKMRRTYHFMSCSYARTLIDLSDYERGIGPECRRMNPAFSCLKDYVETIKYKNPVVSRMIGALSCLHDLAYNIPTQFRKDVFEILMVMRNYYQQKTVVIPAGYDNGDIQKFAIQECIAVEEHAHRMSNRLFAFYNRHCWPISDYVRDNKCSGATELVRTVTHHARVINDNTFAINSIKEEMQLYIEGFLDSFDNASGFEYVSEPDTTRIITFDPETAVRVLRLNQLLANDTYWRSLGVSIKERDIPYKMKTEELLKKYRNHLGEFEKVTPENVYNKLKLAHLFLSCKYAYILKKCCGHTASMWTNCQESQDSICLDKFLQILNENDPSVMRMIDGLAKFQRLSPNTTYKIGVYDSLLLFKRFYVERNALPRNTRNVESWSPAIEKDISEILQTTNEFHTAFCVPSDNFYPSYVGDNVTIDDKGASFIEDIDKDTSLFVLPDV